ncbi:MAG: response regulator [Deltaproteobacteria bacterium]|nr:response regulator [Deltaproteobacteria bacterium]TLN00951.1 MAG: response regulator [bacterium]
MRLKDVRIGTQLRIGLGVIMVLVALLGAMSWYQADKLWQETKGLYDHPYQVRRALSELRYDVQYIRQGMTDLLLVGKDKDRHTILQAIDNYEADAYRQFEILSDRYLGPRSDVEQARVAFGEWKANRDETIRLLDAGRIDEAARRIGPHGIGGEKAAKILSNLQRISDFALARGDKFYRTAQAERDSLMLGLWCLLGFILLTTMAISYQLLKGIREPLQELTSATGAYSGGQLDVRSNYESVNEFGMLVTSFNQLADSVQTELHSREIATRMAAVMLAEEDLRCFCRELLKAQLEHTGSQIGAVYLLNGEKSEFELFESIGLGEGGRGSFSATAPEGEFGTALATGRIQRISDIPADTRFTFQAVSGSFLPREILTIPILSGKAVVAMISLASVRNYPDTAIRLLNDTLSTMTARLNGVLAFRKVREFSEKLEVQNRELEEQKRELTVQADELSEQNIELELQKKQLDEANRLKSAFLSNMSHELRTPLNSVIALAGVLNRRLKDAVPAEEYSYLEVIERNGRQLLALINDILDLSRIEAGREEVSLSRFTVAELVNEVATMIEPQAREKGVTLLNSVSDTLPEMRSDFSKCRHILQNIIGNAVKFTEQGRVEVSAKQVADTILIAVSDSGIGIAAEDLFTIFDEFRQADGSTSRRFGGTGLGLAIAKKYADLLEGTITVESTPGQGSTFTITLPVASEMLPGDEWRPEVTLHSTSPAPSPQNGTRILLVEDSEPAVIQITDILSEQGYLVSVARDGKEALERIEQAVPDAMILDLMMPEVDGFEVIQKVRGREETGRLPVLILTAKHVTKEELQLLKGNGIHQLIQKGDVCKQELLATVARMAAKSPEKPAATEGKTAVKLLDAKPVILVVEDNPDNMKTVRALLTESCTVVEAFDGRTGVEQARAHLPDLILMDISLPRTDGFAALEEIRADATLCPTPVIALTARAMTGDREEILSRGFDGYLSKPIDADLFHQTIREALDGK